MRLRILPAILVSTAMLSAQATNPAYLSLFPAPDRVIHDVKGTNALDTVAHQMAALAHLIRMVEDLSGGRAARRQLLPEETRVCKSYSDAYTALWKPIENTFPTPEDKKKFLALLDEYNFDQRIQNEMVKMYPAIGEQYSAYLAGVRARQKARMDENTRAVEAAKANDAATAQHQRQQQQPPPKAAQSKSERDLALCVQSGRSELTCMAESLGKGINGMIGEIAPGMEIPTPPPGVRMHGVYQSQGGAIVVFGDEMGQIGCGEVRAPARYTVELKNNQMLVKIDHNGKLIVMPLREDGKLVSSGPLTVTGSVPSGSTTTQTYGTTTKTTMEQQQISAGEVRNYSPAEVTRNGMEYSVKAPKTTSTYGPTGTTTTPTYTTKTASCTLGLMSPNAAATSLTVENLLGNLGGGSKLPQPAAGLRMTGTFSAAGGMSVKFYPESAMMICRDASQAYSYTVEKKDSLILVKVMDGAKAVVLTLHPDGSLSGAGSFEAPSLRGCAFAVMTPEKEGAAKSAETTATTATLATPNNPSGGPASLSIASGFTVSAGTPNPLAGHTFTLLKDSLETILGKVGFQTTADISAIQAMFSACTNRDPSCRSAVDAMNAQTAAGIKSDSTGNAQFGSLPAGTYYLVGSARLNNRLTVWNLKVELQPGANSVILGPNNAAVK
jgi:hypothetical protein